MDFMIRTVVTQNIQGFPNFVRAKKHITRFILKIQPYSPDIILLQEVFREKWLLKNTKVLTEYTPLYKTNSLFIEGGLVILIRKNLYNHLLSLGCQFNLFYQNYNKQGVIRSAQLVSHISKKGYLHLRISTNKGVFDIINTHTTSAFNSKANKINKKLNLLLSQLNQFKKFLSSLPNSNKIIGGDFNYDIIQDSDLFNLYSHFPIQKLPTFPKNSSRIDFILTDNLNIESGILLRHSSDRISDHNGLFVSIR
jgi:endonuclease/exonuclease/phosphatase family metal-dependent hydrolase